MTNPTLERAEQAAKREIDRLRKRRVEVSPERFSDGLGWENLNEVVAATTRAVLMAVRDSNLTVRKVPATVDGAYADIVTIRNDGVAAMIDAILNDGEGE